MTGCTMWATNGVTIMIRVTQWGLPNWGHSTGVTQWGQAVQLPTYTRTCTSNCRCSPHACDVERIRRVGEGGLSDLI